MKDEQKSIRQRVGENEWALRVELAAAYRVFAMFGWTHLIHTHITVRVPGERECFLINPYGLLWDEITASS
ncbi:MAG: class II aldolase, partial [Opitutae bacterium]|nr:class II aldolase [Opitutae bacterium]